MSASQESFRRTYDVIRNFDLFVVLLRAIPMTTIDLLYPTFHQNTRRSEGRVTMIFCGSPALASFAPALRTNSAA